jgi:TolA-binding protein
VRKFFLISLVTVTAVSLLTVGFFSRRSREQALYEQAMAALDENLSGAAVEYLTTFLVKYPESELYPDALRQRATIFHLYQSRYLEAISDLRELLNKYPTSRHAFQARRMIAEILETKVRDCRRAIVEYQRLIDDYETVVDDDLFQYRIASCFYELLNFEQSKLEFYKLINNYPASKNVDDSYYQIANILQTQGALEDAQKAYQLYLARYPEGNFSVDAKFNLAATLEEMEELEEALRMYQEVFEEYPNKEAVSWRIEKVAERIEKRGR